MKEIIAASIIAAAIVAHSVIGKVYPYTDDEVEAAAVVCSYLLADNQPRIAVAQPVFNLPENVKTLVLADCDLPQTNSTGNKKIKL